MTVKELIDKLQQFNGDRVVLVEDTEYGEFQTIDVKPEDDRFVMITTTVKIVNIDANGLYVIRKAGSNRAGFIKFDD